MTGAWLVLAFVGGAVLGWIVGVRDRCRRAAAEARVERDVDAGILYVGDEEELPLLVLPPLPTRLPREVYVGAVAEDDAVPEWMRVREVFVGADANEDELKRRYGENVVIHRSDR